MSLASVVASAKAAGSAVVAPVWTKEGNLWAHVVQHNKDTKSGGGGGKTVNLFLCGARSAGKTTLLNNLLFPERDHSAAPRPTDLLEYCYLPKANPESGTTDVANIWEIAGGAKLEDAMLAAEGVVLNMWHVTSAVVLVLVDLSKPAEALSSLEEELRKVRGRVNNTFEGLTKKGKKLPDQLVKRSRRVFGEDHEDVDKVSHSGISIVVVATKYDSFRNLDAEYRKVLARALRFVAHTNGCALFFLGGLAGSKGASDRDKEADKAAFRAFRVYLDHLVYTGADKPYAGKSKFMPRKDAPEVDHGKHIAIPFGGDYLKAIGGPGGAVDGATIEQWREIYNKYFPPTSKTAGGGADWVMDRVEYAEAEVDAVCAAKHAELAALNQMTKQPGFGKAKALASLRAAAQRKTAAAKKS